MVRLTADEFYSIFTLNEMTHGLSVALDLSYHKLFHDQCSLASLHATIYISISSGLVLMNSWASFWLLWG